MKIKVLFLINNLNRGGAERNFLNQANNLDREKFDLCFATVIKEKKEDSFWPELKLEPEKKICFDFKNLSDWAAWFRFIRFLSKEKFDVVYSTLFFANFLNRIGRIFTFLKTKSVIREANIAEVKPKKEMLADKILSFLTYKIIAVSEMVAQSIVKLEKIPASKISVIYNGIALPEKITERNAVRRKFNLGASDFVFLNVGMFKTEQKGQKYLIEAFDKLLGERPGENIKLLLVGEGSLKSELETAVKSKGLSDKIIFAGLQTELHGFYQASDVFVLSSLWEGCPNVLLEAMINKLPVVAAKVGGVGEMVEHLKTGYLVSAKDVPALKQAMAFMLAENERRQNFKEQGFRRALNDFSLGKNIKKLEILFEKCAES